jgi:hypothetical protein
MTSATTAAAAPITSTIPAKRASVRTASTPIRRRLSLRRSILPCSHSSEPKAFTTCMADSASVASEAISPSCARCVRASAFVLRV